MNWPCSPIPPGRMTSRTESCKCYSQKLHHCILDGAVYILGYVAPPFHQRVSTENGDRWGIYYFQMWAPLFCLSALLFQGSLGSNPKEKWDGKGIIKKVKRCGICFRKCFPVPVCTNWVTFLNLPCKTSEGHTLFQTQPRLSIYQITNHTVFVYDFNMQS
jgi:hypothetical protein